MSMNSAAGFYLKMLLTALFFAVTLPLAADAAGGIENLIPAGSCGTGWKMEGKTVVYDQDTLSDRIDGEAELYFPYGFDRMIAARYESEKKDGAGIDVEVFRMGSLLDSFGMFANYRQKDGRTVALGAESNLSGSQLFFYQGRHFIHIQMTGGESTNPEAVLECAKAVAALLPGEINRPPELAAFDRPGIIRGTERYLPQSLLGYDFLNKGIMAEAAAGEGSYQLFRLVNAPAGPVSAAYERFRSQLAGVKTEPSTKNPAVLEGVDPLYGPVMVLMKGDCLVGALRFTDKSTVRPLLESVCK